MKSVNPLLFLIFLFISCYMGAQESDKTYYKTEQERNNNSSDSKEKTTSQNSQKDKPSFFDRVYFGGNFGASFGAFSYFQVNPSIGYLFTKQFSAGISLNYIFANNQKRDFHVYGAGIFARHTFFDRLILQTDLEFVNADVFIANSNEYERIWLTGWLAGGGIFQPIGKKGGIFIMLMYNLLYNDQRSYYRTPLVFRTGFSL